MRKYILPSIIILSLYILISGFSANKKEGERVDSPRMWSIYEAQKLSGFVNHSTGYPYHATKGREKFLRNIFPRVQKAKTVEEAIKLLGKPDEKQRSYATETPGERRVRYSYLYYILKIEKSPNIYNKCLEITFDDEGDVLWINPPDSRYP